MTFSITARCARTGQLGIALSSSSIAVGARCPWLLAGVGAVCSQNITLPSLGPQILARLEKGTEPKAALREVLVSHRYSDYRQVTVIDIHGRTACFSGAHTLGVYCMVQGKECVAAGNMLASTNVIRTMAETFAQTKGELTTRLLTALNAGVREGGEAGSVHSAAVKVVDSYPWPVVDLRVDWAEQDPVALLHGLWLAYEPQMMPYLIRAIDPREAPAYGVPGDE